MICIYPSELPIYKFKHNGKLRQFEWHPQCGPNLHGKDGNPLDNQPMWFLRAATVWNKNGRPLTAEGFADL